MHAQRIVRHGAVIAAACHVRAADEDRSAPAELRPDQGAGDQRRGEAEHKATVAWPAEA